MHLAEAATEAATSCSAWKDWPRPTTGLCSATSLSTSSAANAGDCWGPTGQAKPPCCDACWGCCLGGRAAPPWARGSEVGYFDQQLAGAGRPSSGGRSPRPPQHKLPRAESARDLLARFGLTGDTALQILSQAQRGQSTAARRWPGLRPWMPIFLVLDEPTNHLDLSAHEALEQALAEFGGTVPLCDPRPLFCR